MRFPPILGFLASVLVVACGGEDGNVEGDEAAVTDAPTAPLITEVDYAAKATVRPTTLWSSEASFAKGKEFDAAQYMSTVFDRYGKGAKLHELQGTPHQEYKKQFGLVGKGDSTPVPITIRYAVVEPTGTPRNETIVLVHGMTESSAAYAEVAMDLAAEGYTIFVPNHRGHGFSDRLVDPASQTAPQVDNVSKHVHIGDFEDYVKDLHLVVEKAKARGGKLFAIAHSMGGGIMTRYLELHPTEIDRAVLVAPMHKINVDSGALAPLVRGLADFRGERDDASRSDLPPKQVPFDATKMTLANDFGTTSAIRFGARNFAGVEMSKTQQTFTNGGATFGWVREVILGTKQIRTDAGKIKTPVLILQAHDDHYVVASGHEEVCRGMRAAKSTCSILHFGEGKSREVPGGTKHEILYHNDIVRNAALNAILAHLSLR